MAKEENKEIPITLDGQQMTLALGRCGIALFRYEPDKDYLDVWKEVGSEDDSSEEHHWVFGNRELCLWLGGISITPSDARLIRLSERNQGPFTAHSGGWRPPVIVEDYASETETEMFIHSLMMDVERFQGIDDSFL